MHAKDSGSRDIAKRVLPERVLDGADADLRRQQPLDVGSTEQQCHGKNFTGPPIALHAACPPFMYCASKPASRSAPAVWHPMWKPYTQKTTTGSVFESSPAHSLTRSGSRHAAPSMMSRVRAT